MKNRMYLRILAKRTAKMYPSVLVVTIAVIFATLLAVYAIFLGLRNSGEDKVKVSVGVVGNTTESFFDIGIDVIKEIDDSRYYIDIISMSEEEAMQALSRDEIVGYIVIPESFVNSIASMKNKSATYYLPNKPDSLQTSLTKEVIDTVSVYITESQKSVAGLSAFIRENGLERGMYLDLLSIRIMANAILPRNSLYSVEYTADSVISVFGYYTAGILLFFLLLWGISFYGIMVKKNYAMPKLLYSKGIGSIRQVLCEYTVYLLTILLSLLILAVLFGIFLSATGTNIGELSGFGVKECIFYILGITPVILTVCAMQVLMYETVRGTVASVLLQFLTAVIFGYVSGLFYPNYFFPEGIRTVSALLPVGASFEYMQASLTSEFAALQFVLLVSYTVIFLFAASVIRKKRLAGDM